MGRPQFKANPKSTAVFDDLERFQDFCRSYGYRFNESDLYHWRSYAWQQFNKFLQGKHAKDMWTEDANRFARR